MQQGIENSEYVAETKRIIKRVGDVYLLDEIGRGAFAVVYKGTLFCYLTRREGWKRERGGHKGDIAADPHR